MHDGHHHDHEHNHSHMHTHEHTHDTGGDLPRELALLKYMLEHNRQHAEELSAAGDKLQGEGRESASALIAEAVHYFGHGNDKLREAVEILDGGV